ncbi:chitin-binding protein [Acrocarpospora corrugata]|uniref:Chitin-binding protein n=1 Tax=Acrocarpospora corrugata TaxID=35763 RepID=A0A5M3WA99_9ACTN|nr:lytic polysaccharide monooxygenase [Acrocarpospora corrugata]GES04942.1 chitin-binding protein [Acrocarpospora corrugata]
MVNSTGNVALRAPLEQGKRIRRRLTVWAAALLLALGTGLVVTPTQATAHGVNMFPGARTFLCWQDGLRDNGQIQAYNPACGQAIAANGTTPLYNWFAVLRSDAGGRTTGFIPDGQICSGGSGGPYNFSGYNAARTDWPTTHLTSGASYQFRYSNWAAHPGTFQLYITRNGWNPSAPLAWSDLQSFGSVTNPPMNGGPGALNYYFWNQQLPTGKTGRHIIYIQWVRSDSQENFFSCSDVVFDGGTGQVTGVGPNQSSPSNPGSPSPNSPSPNSPSPNSPSPNSPSPGNGACTATYANNPINWPGHFQGTVTVRNNSGSTLNGWTVRWNFSGGQTFEGQPWNATVTTGPPNVVVRNAPYNGNVAANGTTSFGFNGAGNTPSPIPTLTCTSP